MSNRFKRGAAVAVTAIVIATGAVSAQAATSDHEVRKGDFLPVPLSDTRATGAYGFGPKGLVVDTQGATSTDKVAEYFSIGTDFPTSGAYDWTGSEKQPGSQIVFDADQTTGNGNDYNILVGEQVYSTNAAGGDLTDWWLNGPGGDGQARATANGYTCPETTGGSGSNCHGTLAQWKAALPNAKVLAGGFSLGSGVKGDGWLKSQTFGEDKYTFTDTPATGQGTTPPPAVTPESHTSNTRPTGTGTFANRNRLAVVQLRTNALPANNRGAAKISWTIKVQGVSRFSSTQGFGEVQNFRWTFSKKGGSKKVEILRNGAHYKTAYVTTR